jgi:hypothetical protein
VSSRARPLGLVLAALAALVAIRAAGLLMGPLPAAGPVAVPASLGSTPTAARPAVLTEATAASLLLGGEDGLLRVDLDARRVRPVFLPVGAAGADGGLVQRDGMVVAVRGGAAYAASGRPGPAAAWLGPASYALASAAPGRVWLVEQTGDPDRWYRVREVALGGPAKLERSMRSRVVARGNLPLGRRPVAGVPGGLLVDVVGPDGGLAVWDLRAGRLRQRLHAGSPVGFVAARGRLVAWVEGSTLHLGDLATGQDRVVAPPAGSDGFTSAGAFSPDGRVLAAVTRVGFSTRPALALVRLDAAAATRVAGSEGALSDRCSPCLAWAPGGDWVFFNRLGPGLGIGAYRLDRPRAVTVPLDVPGTLPPSFATI